MLSQSHCTVKTEMNYKETDVKNIFIITIILLQSKITKIWNVKYNNYLNTGWGIRNNISVDFINLKDDVSP